MSRTFLAGAVIVSLGVSAVQAATLDISIAAQGANYNNMVGDVKLRGDGGLQDWNLGAGNGGTNRFYANFLLDGTTSSGRMNTFLQRFDVSSIPSGSTINSATLTVYLANQTANGRTWENVKLSRLLSGNSWVETLQAPPGTAGPHFDGSVTWNNRISLSSGATPWAVAGATGAADIELGTTQTFNIVGVDGSATTVVRDISAWVQAWVTTPSSNAGIAWYGGNSADSGSGNRYFHFGVKEDGAGPAGETNAAAPTLVIDYTVGGGTTAPIINEVAPDPDSVFAGSQYSKQLTLSQGTNPITWTVQAGSPPGTTVSGSGLVSGWTPTNGDIGSTFTINIKAENTAGNDIESWQVTVQGVPPVIAEVAPDPDTASVGTPYSKQLTLTQGTLPVTWSKVQGPASASIDSNGLVSGWTPLATDAGQTFTFEFKAQNPYGNDTELWSVQVLRKNNGFPIDAVYVVRDPGNGGQVRAYDKHSAPPGTRFLSVYPGDGNIQPDGTAWESITFSGTGNGNDARMFLARPTPVASSPKTDIEIAEINAAGGTVNSTTLSAIINTSVGPAVALGNIRYSNLSNTLFLALVPNTAATSTAVCYEFPLSLANNSRIHTYVGETVPADPLPGTSSGGKAAVAINRRDGTLYMTGQHLGDATASGLGDVLAFSTTTGPFNGQGVNTTFAVLIDGQTCNTNNVDYVQPSTAIYRKIPTGDDLLLIPTNTDTDTPVLEFYLNTTLHPVDGSGNLALRTDNGSPLTIGRGWNGQQDLEGGDIWLGARHHGFHVIRANDATAAYENSPTARDWMDAAVPPFQTCHEPFADTDSDGDVDLDDFAALQNCFTGTGGGVPAGCGCFDRASDGDIDVADFNAFTDCATGSKVPWSMLLTPNCSP